MLDLQDSRRIEDMAVGLSRITETAFAGVNAELVYDFTVTHFGLLTRQIKELAKQYLKNYA